MRTVCLPQLPWDGEWGVISNGHIGDVRGVTKALQLREVELVLLRKWSVQVGARAECSNKRGGAEATPMVPISVS